MILMIDTDDAYLVILISHSSIAGHYYFTNRVLDYYKGNPTSNRSILEECKTIKTVVSSSDEAETGGTFENVQNVIQIWNIF